MNQYIGTKIINAKPMTRLEYNQFRGWELPADENGADEGYLVEYVDGGKANTKEYSGYVSWSPKDVFERAYRENGKLTFGDALVHLKNGKKVARAGWNGKNMWLVYMPPFVVEHPNERTQAHGITEAFDCGGYIVMWTAQGVWQPGWLASQNDMLSEDWLVLD